MFKAFSTPALLHRRQVQPAASNGTSGSMRFQTCRTGGLRQGFSWANKTVPQHVTRTSSSASYPMEEGAGGEASGDYQPFPRIREQDPYRALGVAADAADAEIVAARNYYREMYKWHEPSCDAIELAYDRIVQRSLLMRSKKVGQAQGGTPFDPLGILKRVACSMLNIPVGPSMPAIPTATRVLSFVDELFVGVLCFYIHTWVEPLGLPYDHGLSGLAGQTPYMLYKYLMARSEAPALFGALNMAVWACGVMCAAVGILIASLQRSTGRTPEKWPSTAGALPEKPKTSMQHISIAHSSGASSGHASDPRYHWLTAKLRATPEGALALLPRLRSTSPAALEPLRLWFLDQGFNPAQILRMVTVAPQVLRKRALALQQVMDLVPQKMGAEADRLRRFLVKQPHAWKHIRLTTALAHLKERYWSDELGYDLLSRPHFHGYLDFGLTKVACRHSAMRVMFGNDVPASELRMLVVAGVGAEAHHVGPIMFTKHVWALIRRGRCSPTDTVQDVLQPLLRWLSKSALKQTWETVLEACPLLALSAERTAPSRHRELYAALWDVYQEDWALSPVGRRWLTAEAAAKAADLSGHVADAECDAEFDRMLESEQGQLLRAKYDEKRARQAAQWKAHGHSSPPITGVCSNTDSTPAFYALVMDRLGCTAEGMFAAIPLSSAAGTTEVQTVPESHRQWYLQQGFTERHMRSLLSGYPYLDTDTYDSRLKYLSSIMPAASAQELLATRPSLTAHETALLQLKLRYGLDALGYSLSDVARYTPTLFTISLPRTVSRCTALRDLLGKTPTPRQFMKAVGTDMIKSMPTQFGSTLFSAYVRQQVCSGGGGRKSGSSTNISSSHGGADFNSISSSASCPEKTVQDVLRAVASRLSQSAQEKWLQTLGLFPPMALTSASTQERFQLYVTLYRIYEQDWQLSDVGRRWCAAEAAL